MGILPAGALNETETSWANTAMAEERSDWHYMFATDRCKTPPLQLKAIHREMQMDQETMFKPTRHTDCTEISIFVARNQVIYFSNIGNICLAQTPNRVCYPDHIFLSDALNNSQKLHEKCKPCRSVLIRGDKRMWSNIYRWLQQTISLVGYPSLLSLSTRRFCDQGMRVLIGGGRGDINSQQSSDASSGGGGGGWWLCWALTQSAWGRWIMCTQAWGGEAEWQADLQHQQTGGSERFIYRETAAKRASWQSHLIVTLFRGGAASLYLCASEGFPLKH